MALLPPPAEEIALLTALHGACLRRLSNFLNRDVDGLTVAARIARKQGAICNSTFKRLERIDAAFAVIRHATAPKFDSFYASLDAQIKAASSSPSPSPDSSLAPTSCSTPPQEDHEKKKSDEDLDMKDHEKEKNENDLDLMGASLSVLDDLSASVRALSRHAAISECAAGQEQIENIKRAMNFDVMRLLPGDKLQWRNSYRQWQNARFIGPALDGEGQLIKDRFRIKEEKNDRQSYCSSGGMRSRYDEYGQLRQQQF